MQDVAPEDTTWMQGDAVGEAVIAAAPRVRGDHDRRLRRRATSCARSRRGSTEAGEKRWHVF